MAIRVVPSASVHASRPRNRHVSKGRILLFQWICLPRSFLLPPCHLRDPESRELQSGRSETYCRISQTKALRMSVQAHRGAHQHGNVPFSSSNLWWVSLEHILGVALPRAPSVWRQLQCLCWWYPWRASPWPCTWRRGQKLGGRHNGPSLCGLGVLLLVGPELCAVIYARRLVTSGSHCSKYWLSVMLRPHSM